MEGGTTGATWPISQKSKLSSGIRYGWSKYEVTQDKTEDVHTKVKPGYDERHDTFTTDFVVADRKQGGHVHCVYDEDGNEIVDHWRDR